MSFCFVNAKTIFVTPNGTGNGSSWNNAYGNLQTAIDNASVGDEIWVKQGTYIPTIHKSSITSSHTYKFFALNKNIKIYGGFKGDETALDQRDWVNNKTILSGDQNQNNGNLSDFKITTNRTDDSRRVLVVVGNLVDAVVDGFYMMYTYNNSTSLTQSYDGVALQNTHFGIVVSNCTGLTLRNLDISYMYSLARGGLNIYQSTVNIENIKIHKIYSNATNNNFNYSSISAKNLNIENSESQSSICGLALYVSKKSSFENLQIKNNTGSVWGVLDLYNCDTIKINRSNISFNQISGMSPISLEQSKLILMNTLLTNNYNTTNTAGIFITNNGSNSSDSYLNIINCTIANNQTPTSNFNLISAPYGNDIELRNSILYNPGKRITTLHVSKSLNNYLSSSVSYGVSTNTVIRTENPFVDMANNNYQLQIGSIARNGADSTLLLERLGVSNLNNQLDALGNPRRNQAGKLDIGAVEDTLVDALLNTLKYDFQAKIQHNQTIIQSNIHSTEFVQLKLKAGIHENNLLPIQQYKISANKSLDEQLILPYTHYNFVEWWAVNQLGQEVLLKHQNLSAKGKKMELSIYPNPAIDHITIVGINETIQKIQLFDLTGKLIQSLELSDSSNHYKIPVSSLKTGMYIITAISADDIQTVRFIKR